ncbi:MAG: helix-turn-helix domain-containing protein [Candidatus Doudnabacteria bacterium]|nr:helix-turn-helix domain-containing protein [Candidatus Doudnabacteria bacterium]
MEILDTLKQAGLNEKQAAVYMALLELGTATVHPIATKAQVKRPTTYLILEDLQARGLVSVVPRARKVLYTAESPEKIVSDLGRKQDLVKRYLPQLLALYNAKVDKPQVLLFEGKDAVREVYERILDAKEVAWFSTIRDIISVYPDFPKKLNDEAMKGRVKVRELLTKSPADLEYIKTMRHGENFSQRFVKGEGDFMTDNCLYDGNAVFFSFQPYISAIQIRSQGIYRSLTSLYEFAWKASEPIDTP